MKLKTMILTGATLLAIQTGLFSQDKAKAKSIDNVVWLGIDFTMAKFSFVPEDPAIIVNQYLKAINMLIPSQPEKFNIKNFFNKNDVTVNLDLVNELNSKLDPSHLVISSDYKIDPSEIKKVITKYGKGKSGTGLIFIAENLNKATQTGSYYVVFFNLATREIIDSEHLVGNAGGFGFRNYWAATVYNIMKSWLNQ
jgi:hypothetical protein